VLGSLQSSVGLGIGEGIGVGDGSFGAVQFPLTKIRFGACGFILKAVSIPNY
jgi:hypothetical protein